MQSQRYECAGPFAATGRASGLVMAKLDQLITLGCFGPRACDEFPDFMASLKGLVEL